MLSQNVKRNETKEEGGKHYIFEILSKKFIKSAPCVLTNN